MARTYNPRILLLTLVPFMLTACPVVPGPTEPTPGPAPEGRQPGLCGQACARWGAMACEEGKRVCDAQEPGQSCAKWIGCEEWCTKTETSGPQSLNLGCIVEAPANDCMALEDACAY